MNLYESTTEIHHQAETSALGEKMLNGKVSRQEYTNWLYACYRIHLKLDVVLDPSLRRAESLMWDLVEMSPLVPKDVPQTQVILDQMDKDPKIMASMCYLMCGANFRGGQVVRKKIKPLGFPVHHLEFGRNQALQADTWIKEVRQNMIIAEDVKRIFKQFITIMDQCAEDEAQQNAA